MFSNDEWIQLSTLLASFNFYKISAFKFKIKIILQKSISHTKKLSVNKLVSGHQSLLPFKSIFTLLMQEAFSPNKFYFNHSNDRYVHYAYSCPEKKSFHTTLISFHM